MQFSPWSIFLPFRSKYPPQHAVLKNPQSVYLQVRDQVSHPYSTTGKITVLCILIFRFFDMRREDKKILDMGLNIYLHAVIPVTKYIKTDCL
jgi:hypothetical protein